MYHRVQDVAWTHFFFSESFRKLHTLKNCLEYLPNKISCRARFLITTFEHWIGLFRNFKKLEACCGLAYSVSEISLVLGFSVIGSWISKYPNTSEMNQELVSFDRFLTVLPLTRGNSRPVSLLLGVVFKRHDIWIGI